jgi:hypothetical protein
LGSSVAPSAPALAAAPGHPQGEEAAIGLLLQNRLIREHLHRFPHGRARDPELTSQSLRAEMPADRDAAAADRLLDVFGNPKSQGAGGHEVGPIRSTEATIATTGAPERR